MEQLINRLRAELFDSAWCKQDFEKYDVKSLQSTCEPFLWMAREHGTTLSFIGPTKMNQLLQSESWRIALMKNELDAIADILYWNDESARYFYWSGHELTQVEKKDLSAIFQRVWSDRISKLREEYPEEYAVIDKPLELEMTPEIEQRVNEAKLFAEQLKDNSLSNCLQRLTHWTRQAVDHKVEVYWDFAPHSFGFCEKINDKPNINGGIIFSSHAPKNRWSIHT